MNKGVIFTMDAIVAFAIFIASLFLFYSYFVTVEPFGLRGAGIYTKADNFLSVEDSSEDFSKVLYYYQGVDNKTCNSSSLSYQQLANISKNLTEYASNIRLYVYNDSTKDVSLICSYAPNVFSNKVILRRYVTLSMTRNITAPFPQPSNVTVIANTTYISYVTAKPVPIYLTVYNPYDTIIDNLVITVSVKNSTNNPTGWVVYPPSYRIQSPWAPPTTWPPLAPHENRTIFFNVTIPIDAVIDEYAANASCDNNLTGPPGWAQNPFNIVQFGMVELEVGT